MVRPSFIKSLSDTKMTIKDWFIEIVCYNPISCYIRKVCRFIKRLITWIPTLWKIEEWDFGYTYIILEKFIKDIRHNITQDTWHTPDCIQEELEQIDETLLHLDKYRNWTNYVDIPEPGDDFERFSPTEDGLYTMNFTDEEHKAYEEANKFEEENYNAFWECLKRYSSNWWT